MTTRSDSRLVRLDLARLNEERVLAENSLQGERTVAQDRLLTIALVTGSQWLAQGLAGTLGQGDPGAGCRRGLYLVYALICAYQVHRSASAQSRAGDVDAAGDGAGRLRLLHLHGDAHLGRGGRGPPADGCGRDGPGPLLVGRALQLDPRGAVHRPGLHRVHDRRALHRARRRAGWQPLHHRLLHRPGGAHRRHARPGAADVRGPAAPRRSRTLPPSTGRRARALAGTGGARADPARGHGDVHGSPRLHLLERSSSPPRSCACWTTTSVAWAGW